MVMSIPFLKVGSARDSVTLVNPGTACAFARMSNPIEGA